MWTLTEERKGNEQKDTVMLLRRKAHEREHYLYLNTDTSLCVGRGGVKVTLLQRTAVMVEILRNTYLQCVRKCKMYVLKFQTYKVRV